MSSGESTVSKVLLDQTVSEQGMPHSFRHLTKNMESELEKRKTDWEQEVSKMQQDFFQMKGPSNGQKQIGGGSKTKVVEMRADSKAPRRHNGTAGAEIFDISHAKTLYCDQPDGSKLFKLRFDVKGYEPHEIGIKAEGQKLVVTAKTEDESREGNKATKQFNRQVDIPNGVDPDKLVSFLSADGILSVEAPVEYMSDDEDEEDGEEVQVVYADRDAAMAGMIGHPGVQPPLYEHVVEGRAPGYSYSTERSRSPGYSYIQHGSPGGGGGGGGGYSYRTSSSTSSQPYVVAPRVSYEFNSCHHGLGHHDCHHKEGPRRPLETHVKRTKNPAPHVDYIKSASPHRTVHSKYSSSTTPGLTGSVLAGSLLSPSTAYTSSISSSSRRSPTIINEQYRYNEPSIVGGDNEGGRRLKLVVDVGRDYTPEDVHVTLHGARRIAVQARRQQTVSGRTSKQEFSRDFHAPEDLESYTARASLGGDGKLYVGACVKGNPDTDRAMQHVLGDMPNDSHACNLALE